MNNTPHHTRYAICWLLLFTIAAFAAQAGATEVSRARFTSAIENREPIDEITQLGIDHARIYFFSEIRNGQGQTVTHRWLYKGKVMAEVSFDIKGPRWRVYSSKNLLPFWTGTWTVQVVDANGEVLTEKRFEYME
ncbi:MAG: DUF2914 domain-containing protein [Gammaproteobacteria bacterium]